MIKKKSSQILITGATGFLGNYLSYFLVNQGYEIKKISRNKCNDEKKDLDLNNEINWFQILDDVDCIVHTAAKVHEVNQEEKRNDYYNINFKATERLAQQASESGVRRFIYISTVKVNGEFTDINFPINEKSKNDINDFYSESKKKSEDALIEISKKTEMEVVIIRPPLIYGPNVGANFLKMITWINREIPLPLKDINNSRSMIYIKNLCDFISKCINHEKASNEIFLISDDQDVSTSSLLNIISQKLNKRIRLFYFPKVLLYLLLLFTGNKGTYNKIFLSLNINISKAKELLDWKPKYSINDGIEDTIKFYKIHGS